MPKMTCVKCSHEWIVHDHPSVSKGGTTVHVCDACHNQMVRQTMACKEWAPMDEPEVSRCKSLTIGDVAEEMVRRDNDKFLKKQAAEAAARNAEAAARAAEAAGEAGKRDKWEAVKV